MPRRRAKPQAVAYDPAVQADLEAARAREAERAEAERAKDRRARARERYRLSKKITMPTPPAETRRAGRNLPDAPVAGRIQYVDLRDWQPWKDKHGLVTEHYDPRAQLFYVTDKPEQPPTGDSDGT